MMNRVIKSAKTKSAMAKFNKPFKQPYYNSPVIKMFGKEIYQRKNSSKSESTKNESTTCDENVRKKVKISSEKEISSVKATCSVSENFLILIKPLILDINQKDYNQPILIKMSQQQLLDLDININQNFDPDEEMNLFCFWLKDKRISFRLISSGASKEELKENLCESIKQNATWGNLKKAIDFSENFLSIEQDPSAIMEEKLPYICIGQEEFINLFKNVTNSTVESTNNSVENPKSKKVDLCVDDNEDDSILKNSQKTTQKSTFIKVQEIDSKRISYDCKLEKIQKVHLKLTEVQRQKMLLSEIDLSGILIKSLIDIVSDIFELMELTDGEKESGCVKVPEIDKTYKESESNRIYLEGIIELELDSYEKAINQAKPNNPCSIAYQLVRFAFPEPYVNRVTLGKKNYTHAELASYDVDSDRGENEEKIPLAYVFSFPDPFNAPGKGEFDPILGKQRLSSFFDHVFRKAGYEKFNEEQANKVRSRVIKELCSRNKEYCQNHDKDPINISEDSKKIDSNILDSDFFKFN